jgi:hypothetical protein
MGPNSRIPILSPNSRAESTTSSRQLNIPKLAVSDSHHQSFLSESTQSISQSHLARAREAMKTPEPRRPGPRATLSEFRGPRSSLTPSLGPRSVSGSSVGGLLTPRTMPHSRLPPSSFRSNTPTPFGMARPSSRLSMKSYSNYNPAILLPFKPSKFDLLDQQVQAILEDTGFHLFVSRVDPSMKRGQIRSEGEEWKGEYVFGAGEKPVGVKLVILRRGARVSSMERECVKCLVRVGGAWVDLAGVLEARIGQESRRSVGDSP